MHKIKEFIRKIIYAPKSKKKQVAWSIFGFFELVAMCVYKIFLAMLPAMVASNFGASNFIISILTFAGLLKIVYTFVGRNTLKDCVREIKWLTRSR